MHMGTWNERGTQQALRIWHDPARLEATGMSVPVGSVSGGSGGDSGGDSGGSGGTAKGGSDTNTHMPVRSNDLSFALEEAATATD